jgi:hypothetical protein
MNDDQRTVPEPDEADRDDAIHYHDVDETNVSGAEASPAPGDDENQPGAEGGDSESADRPPGAPADDDAPLGDTDQHSDADA